LAPHNYFPGAGAAQKVAKISNFKYHRNGKHTERLLIESVTDRVSCNMAQSTKLSVNGVSLWFVLLLQMPSVRIITSPMVNRCGRWMAAVPWSRLQISENGTQTGVLHIKICSSAPKVTSIVYCFQTFHVSQLEIN